MTRLLLTAGILLATAAAHAQPVPSAFPISPAELDGYFDRPARVEVNLRGALLRLAAQAAGQDDPAAADLFSGLRGVTVRVYQLADARDGLADRLTGLESNLEGLGWMTMVRVRPDPDEGDDEDVWVYVREAGDTFEGLAVMALDHAEGNAAFILIDGRVTPEQVGRLSARFGGPDLDDDDDAVGDDANDDAGDDE